MLPFRVAGPSDDEWLAQGLTEEIIDSLSMTRGLRVRPYSAVAGAARRDPMEIAGALSVEVVVDGSVRRMGEQVRIAARLVGVADGFQLWAQRWEALPAEALRIADDAARAIAEALTVDLAGRVRLAPTDPELVELLLRGRQAMRAQWDGDLSGPIALLEQARARRPEDADVLAALATALARQAFLDGAGIGRGLERAQAVADLATRLASDRVETWLAQSACRRYAIDMAGAAHALRRATTLAPGNAGAQAALGGLLIEAGSLEEGIACVKAGCALDPTLGVALVDCARALALAGRWAEVEAPLRDAVLGLESFHAWLNWARLCLWSKNLRPPPPLPPEREVEAPYRVVLRTLTDGLIDVREGRPSGRDRVRDVLLSRVKDGGRLRLASLQVLAELHGYLGEHELAMESVRDAVAADLMDIAWIDRCPVLEALRAREDWPAARAAVEGRATAVLAACSMDPAR